VIEQDVMAFLSANPQELDDISLSGMYDACTMGQLRLNATGSIVLNIPFPCNGTQLADGTVFTMSTCNNNVLPWQEYAVQQAATLMPELDMHKFQHRVLILPVIMTSVVEGQWARDKDLNFRHCKSRNAFVLLTVRIRPTFGSMQKV
jgi:hypothetical protein